MGLDLYAGPLCRYLSGDWKTILQQEFEARGETLNVIRLGDSVEPLSLEQAEKAVFDYQRRISSEWSKKLSAPFTWSDKRALPYWTDKPDHVGQNALAVWAAYLDHPERTRPETLPDPYDDDPAYQAAYDEKGVNDTYIVEFHLFLPINDSFVFLDEDPVGVKRRTTTLRVLRETLQRIDQKSWNSSPQQREEWARKGPPDYKALLRPAGWMNKIKTRVGMSRDPTMPATSPFEMAAQFGFAVYWQALEFAERHQVPIVTDE